MHTFQDDNHIKVEPLLQSPQQSDQQPSIFDFDVEPEVAALV